MEKTDFFVKYTGQAVFAMAPDNCYIAKPDSSVRELGIKEGEVAHGLRPFGIMDGQANFTFTGRRKGSAFGQITWEVLEP